MTLVINSEFLSLINGNEGYNVTFVINSEFLAPINSNKGYHVT